MGHFIYPEGRVCWGGEGGRGHARRHPHFDSESFSMVLHNNMQRNLNLYVILGNWNTTFDGESRGRAWSFLNAVDMGLTLFRGYHNYYITLYLKSVPDVIILEMAWVLNRPLSWHFVTISGVKEHLSACFKTVLTYLPTVPEFPRQSQKLTSRPAVPETFKIVPEIIHVASA